ncbi:MAG TPA: 6-phosphogluconolactonase [Nocardioidaceae bacterium]|nr:6-phosphogluconolactonase [Nocardioidaceae bacterium]
MALDPSRSHDRERTVVRRSAGPDELSERVAARLISRLVQIQQSGRDPSVVLTGGSIAVRIHKAVAESPDRDLVAWSRVDFWFGDERFVPHGSSDRNAGQAATAMLDRLPVDPARVHPMPASDGEYGEDVDAAAQGYADELGAVGSGDGPLFDVLMLGIGPDGHCASLFPRRPELDEERPVVAVRNSPKPPPTRITLTMGTLNRSREVWFVAAGSDKAAAVRSAVNGSHPVDVPAAGPHGLERTIWMLDDDAASLLSRTPRSNGD